MNRELLVEADGIWQRREKASRFASRFDVYPVQEGLRVVDDLHRLGESIPVHDQFTTEDEVLERELGRRLRGEAVALDHQLSGRYYTSQDVVSLFGIPEEDLTGLKGWLEGHKQETEAVIQRAYEKIEVEGYQLDVPMDIQGYANRAEGLCSSVIDNYRSKLGALFRELTDVGEFLRDIQAVATTNPRSYFNQQTFTLALGIPSICYMDKDRTFHIKHRELIRLFGHEGMGHGLNFVITQGSQLPFFLKEDSVATTATLESTAQHFERIIFDDLAKSPKTQRDLEIARDFEEIYQEEKETQLIGEYQLRFFQYAITVLADTNLGLPQDPETIKRKREMLLELALYPAQAVNMVEGYKDRFDSQGNLNPGLVSELRYCAQPAKKVLAIFKEFGLDYSGEARSSIDMTLLKGLWTPIGIVENATVAARNLAT